MVFFRTRSIEPVCTRFVELLLSVIPKSWGCLAVSNSPSSSPPLVPGLSRHRKPGVGAGVRHAGRPRGVDGKDHRRHGRACAEPSRAQEAGWNPDRETRVRPDGWVVQTVDVMKMDPKRVTPRSSFSKRVKRVSYMVYSKSVPPSKTGHQSRSSMRTSTIPVSDHLPVFHRCQSVNIVQVVATDMPHVQGRSTQTPSPVDGLK